MTDLYETLGVSKDAEADVIKTAYRRLARELHPDVNPGDETAEERFAEVARAYAVLSDEAKRKSYDEFGEIALDPGFDPDEARRAREAFGARFGGYRDADAPHYAEFSFGDLDDLFGRIDPGHARRGGRRRPRPGPDLRAELRLDFLDAARGGEHRLTVSRPRADGVVASETFTVRIPPGVSDGGSIRVPGKGAESPAGGPPGDLHVTLRVSPHPHFERRGRDLHLDLPVTVAEAILGAEVRVPTLNGSVLLTVPPGTDGGSRLRLGGKGLPDARGAEPGDLIATVRIKVPRDLDDEARAHAEALSDAGPANPREELLS